MPSSSLSVGHVRYGGHAVQPAIDQNRATSQILQQRHRSPPSCHHACILAHMAGTTSRMSLLPSLRQIFSYGTAPGSHSIHNGKPRQLPDSIIIQILSHFAMPQPSDDRFIYLSYTPEQATWLLEGRRALLVCAQVNHRFHRFARDALYARLLPLHTHDTRRNWKKFTPTALIGNATSAPHSIFRVLFLRIIENSPIQSQILANFSQCDKLTHLHLHLLNLQGPHVEHLKSSLPRLESLVAVSLHCINVARGTPAETIASSLIGAIATVPRLRCLRLWQVCHPLEYSAALREKNLKILAFESLEGSRDARNLAALLCELGTIQELGLINCSLPLDFWARLRGTGIRIGRLSVFPLPAGSEHATWSLNLDILDIVTLCSLADVIRLGCPTSRIRLNLPSTLRELQLGCIELEELVEILRQATDQSLNGVLPGLQQVTIRGFQVKQRATWEANMLLGFISELELRLMDMVTTKSVKVVPIDILDRLRVMAYEQYRPSENTVPHKPASGVRWALD